MVKSETNSRPIILIPARGRKPPVSLDIKSSPWGLYSSPRGDGNSESDQKKLIRWGLYSSPRGDGNIFSLLTLFIRHGLYSSPRGDGNRVSGFCITLDHIDYTHPREGTETGCDRSQRSGQISIILIPARGRKPSSALPCAVWAADYTHPREGTETTGDGLMFDDQGIILIPARGRKRQYQ